MTCKYKESLGKLGEGVHSYRIFNIAIVDVFFTILLGYVINIFIPKYNIYNIILCIFILGILLHRIFCVDTTINNLIFK